MPAKTIQKCWKKASILPELSGNAPTAHVTSCMIRAVEESMAPPGSLIGNLGLGKC